MIVFEERIEAIVKLLPKINGFTPVFYWGNSGQEVNAFLQLSSQKYPLVYLTSGYEVSIGNFSEVERECVFILAVHEKDSDKLNFERMQDNYNTVLNVLAENLIDALDTSSISRLPEGCKLRRIPNYTESNKHAQIDKWDVIELRCKVVINDKCLKPL